MASLEPRKKCWRLIWIQNGEKQRETFDSRQLAQQFKTLIEANDNNWPDEWTRGVWKGEPPPRRPRGPRPSRRGLPPPRTAGSWLLHCPDPVGWRATLIAKSAAQPDGCIVWTSSLTGSGYGKFSRTHDGIVYTTNASRAAWLAFRGDIPAVGLVPDHLCRNRACVNVDHLELVTNRENCLRGEVGRRRHPRKVA